MLHPFVVRIVCEKLNKQKRFRFLIRIFYAIVSLNFFTFIICINRYLEIYCIDSKKAYGHISSR